MSANARSCSKTGRTDEKHNHLNRLKIWINLYDIVCFENEYIRFGKKLLNKTKTALYEAFITDHQLMTRAESFEVEQQQKQQQIYINNNGWLCDFVSKSIENRIHVRVKCVSLYKSMRLFP